MGVEWCYSKPDSDVVILITKLLKLVGTSPPQCGKFDLYADAANDPVSFAIRGPGYVEVLCGEETGDQLLADLSI